MLSALIRVARAPCAILALERDEWRQFLCRSARVYEQIENSWHRITCEYRLYSKHLKYLSKWRSEWAHDELELRSIDSGDEPHFANGIKISMRNARDIPWTFRRQQQNWSFRWTSEEMLNWSRWLKSCALGKKLEKIGRSACSFWFLVSSLHAPARLQRNDSFQCFSHCRLRSAAVLERVIAVVPRISNALQRCKPRGKHGVLFTRRRAISVREGEFSPPHSFAQLSTVSTPITALFSALGRENRSKSLLDMFTGAGSWALWATKAISPARSFISSRPVLDSKCQPQTIVVEVIYNLTKLRSEVEKD